MKYTFKVYSSLEEYKNEFISDMCYIRTNLGEYEGFINGEMVFATGFASEINRVPLLQSDGRKFIESVDLDLDEIKPECYCPCHTNPGTRHIVACCTPTLKIKTETIELEAFKSPKEIVKNPIITYK